MLYLYKGYVRKRNLTVSLLNTEKSYFSDFPLSGKYVGNQCLFAFYYHVYEATNIVKCLSLWQAHAPLKRSHVAGCCYLCCWLCFVIDFLVSSCLSFDHLIVACLVVVNAIQLLLALCCFCL